MPEQSTEPLSGEPTGAPRTALADRRAAAGVTWLSVGVNVATGLLKCGVGYLGHSRALVADGLHSLSDLGTDIAVLIGLSYAARPPDPEHPYGHHKATSLVSTSIALAIVGFCALLVIDGAATLMHLEPQPPDWPTLVIALLSVGAKEWLYRRTLRVGHRCRSSVVLTNAWHHRTDTVTSLVTAVGIAGAMFLGPAWVFLDALVGVLLGGYLGMAGARLLFDSLGDLMDSAPETAVIDDLREHVLTISGTRGYHEFRARKVGDMIEIDLHLLVDPDLRITQGHEIAAQVKHAITSRHPEVLNVLVHIEPDLPEHRHSRGVTQWSARG